MINKFVFLFFLILKSFNVMAIDVDKSGYDIHGNWIKREDFFRNNFCFNFCEPTDKEIMDHYKTEIFNNIYDFNFSFAKENVEHLILQNTTLCFIYSSFNIVCFVYNICYKANQNFKVINNVYNTISDAFDNMLYIPVFYD